MGKTDIVTKNYMRGSDIFADAFNFLTDSVTIAAGERCNGACRVVFK